MCHVPEAKGVMVYCNFLSFNLGHLLFQRNVLHSLSNCLKYLRGISIIFGAQFILSLALNFSKGVSNLKCTRSEKCVDNRTPTYVIPARKSHPGGNFFWGSRESKEVPSTWPHSPCTLTIWRTDQSL